MYKTFDIKEKIDEILSEENVSTTKLVDAIVDFVNVCPCKSIMREAFKTEEFDKMGEMVGAWTVDEEYCFGGEYESDNTDIEELVNVLKKFIDAENINADTKIEYITEFAKYFGECSEEDDFCEDKIYVIIKNIGVDSNSKGEDEYSIVEEFDNIYDAEKYVDDVYTGCCDDIYFAEHIWFSLLCDIQNNDWYYKKNFSTIFMADAKGLEEGREYWEAENCDCDDDDDCWEDDDE